MAARLRLSTLQRHESSSSGPIDSLAASEYLLRRNDNLCIGQMMALNIAHWLSPYLLQYAENHRGARESRNSKTIWDKCLQLP